MSWQDELRRLDAEVAAGRLNPAEHRRLRDDLLAEASGRTVPSPVASPLRHPAGNTWHSTNPAATPPEARPWPPPPQQPTIPQAPVPPPHSPPVPSQQDAVTLPAQPVPPAPAAGPHGTAFFTDRPTTAPSPADLNPTDALHTGTPAPAGQSTARFPYAAPERGEGNRWDEEMATAPRRSRRLPTWLFLAGGVLLVLVLIIGGTWWLGSDRAKSPQPGETATSASQPSQPQRLTGTMIEERLPQLPGQPYPNNSILSLAKGVDLNLYPRASSELFAQHGATEVVYRGSLAEGTGYLVLAVPTNSGEDARAVTDTLRQGALASGFTALKPDKSTVTGKVGELMANASWYASDNVAVIVWISAPLGADKSALEKQLDQTLSSLRQKLPAR
ncbi:hypothetical protein [Amycolatopsis samaneae]|uniref:Uncharacterized protein n=1 Tax=Amycolatopsis samaneae TaxID=664691 RepID=A0ABW5GER5_9PSEU